MGVAREETGDKIFDFIKNTVRSEINARLNAHVTLDWSHARQLDRVNYIQYTAWCTILIVQHRHQ